MIALERVRHGSENPTQFDLTNLIDADTKWKRGGFVYVTVILAVVALELSFLLSQMFESTLGPGFQLDLRSWTWC